LSVPKRLLRPPTLGAEPIEEWDPHRLIYHLPRPAPDGRTQLILSPWRSSNIAPRGPRRRHSIGTATAGGSRRMRPCGPRSPLWPAPPVATSGEVSAETLYRCPARDLWAMPLARIYEAFPLTCPPCGTEMRILALITEASPVQRILNQSARPLRHRESLRRAALRCGRRTTAWPSFSMQKDLPALPPPSRRRSTNSISA